MNKSSLCFTVVNTNEEALKRAESLDVVGALFETNVAAYYQETFFKRRLSIGVPIKQQQNVTMLYLIKDKERFSEADDYIMCLEQQVMKYADRKKPTLKVSFRKTNWKMKIRINGTNGQKWSVTHLIGRNKVRA